MNAEARQWSRYLLTGASVVIVIAGLRAASSIIVPILLAGFLTVLSLPMLRWFRERGMPNVLAVLATMLAVMAVLAVFGLLVSAALADAGAAAPAVFEQLQDSSLRARDSLRDSPIGEYVSTEQLDPASAVDFLSRTFGGVIRGTVVGLATILSYGTLILIALGFMLAEACSFTTKLEMIRRTRNVPTAHFGQIAVEMQHYLGIKTTVSFFTGVLIFFVTWAAGLEFPLFWALLAFLLNFIPTIGSILAGVPAVLVTLVSQGLGTASLVALGYLTVNLVLGNLIEPRLLGLRFRLSTLVVFLSLLFWGFIWGPIGMLLAVPLTRSLLIVLEHTVNPEWLSILLGRAR